MVATLTAFARALADRKPWPSLKWKYQDSPGGTKLSLESNVAPESARLFRCTAPTLDFRDSKWASTELKVDGRKLVAESQAPESGCAAVFVEATFKTNDQEFTLSTQLRILGKPAGK